MAAMADNPKNTSPAPETPTTETDKEAQDRARLCAQEVEDLCRKHRVKLVAYLLPPEGVGSSGDRVQIQAAYGFVPEVSDG